MTHHVESNSYLTRATTNLDIFFLMKKIDASFPELFSYIKKILSVN